MANRKILHVINGEHYSGGERVQDILAMTLPAFGYDVGFVCLKPDMFPDVYQSKDSPIYSFPMKHKADFSVYKQVQKVIDEEGYEIVHSHMPRTLPVARLACFFTGMPLVHHLHSPTLFEGPSLANNIISGCLERVSLIGARMIVPCSEGLGRYARQILLSKARTRVVLNGIPAIGPKIDRTPEPGKWVFGMVALFRPRKGIEYLLKAMRILKDDGFEFKLRAIGGFFSQEYEQEVLSLVAELGISDSIDWIGFTKDVATELASLDFFVLPSTHGEGLPIAILEAMSIGLPVITTRIDGNIEVIRDGMDGFLCEPEDAESMAASMKKLMGTPDGWQALSSNAFNRQQKYFSDDSMSGAVAKIYDEILMTE